MDIVIFLLMFFLVPISIVLVSYIMFLKNRYDTMYVERVVVLKVKKPDKNIDLMVDDLARSIKSYALFPRNILVLDMLDDRESKDILKKLCVYKGYNYVEDKEHLCKCIYLN